MMLCYDNLVIEYDEIRSGLSTETLDKGHDNNSREE